jgi:hypothetical protein
VVTSSCPPRLRNLDLALFASRELGLWAAVYGGYLTVRGLTIAARTDAVAHARDLAHAEQALGIFQEQRLQHALGPAATFFSAYYVGGFGPVVAGTVVWLALRRRDVYRELRNALLASLGLATIVFVLFPTAPPRLVPGLGISDTVGLSRHDSGSLLDIRFNPYAAVPSMHVGWSLLVAVAGYRAARAGAWRALFALYPALMVVAVAATGNHFFVDSVAGLAVAGATLVLLPVNLRALRDGDVVDQTRGEQAVLDHARRRREPRRDGRGIVDVAEVVGDQIPVRARWDVA